ncbi:MAG TPA: CPBP family intramembrane glutamic endopeptidase [Desulfomonilia bacterium]|nr:CPBP family intramembrane glutamic endopeptidase [Desulfomonilia bacterium]
MDRRFAVIIAVCLMETIFRFFSASIPVDGIVYTLAARLAEIAVILVFAFKLCGVETATPVKEAAIGLTAAAAFGIIVFGADLVSRFFLEGGLLGLMLAKQPLDGWPLFLITGCIIGPFAEELFFRGLLYAWMRQRLPAVICIILTSLLFASMHSGISVIQLTGGIVFASLYEWRKSIWAPFMVHMIANIGIWIIPYLHPLM